MRAYSLDSVDAVARRGRGATGSPRTLPRVPCVHPPGLARWIPTPQHWKWGGGQARVRYRIEARPGEPA